MPDDAENGPELIRKSQENEEMYARSGWNVLSAHQKLPAILARRASRLPKLLPSLFFPHTKTVLYSDMKLLSALARNEASSLASKLLQGTQFGIVQHQAASDFSAERDLILRTVPARPLILDSVELLNSQVLLLESTLSSYHRQAFGVDGELHARVLRNDSNSNLLNKVWFEEYMNGCDRDQIAFYGAAARMDMHRETQFPCSVFNRSGIYRSSLHKEFTFAIHCHLDDVGVKW